MKEDLRFITLREFMTDSGEKLEEVTLTYQFFGKEPAKGPVVLVIHALTGNSTLTGPDGWFNGLCGDGKLIDTRIYSVLAFDIPGNGYSGKPESVLREHDLFTARDVAGLFGRAIKQLGIDRTFAATGAPLGGGIAWEMACLYPELIENLIPIACDWKATDWIIANNRVQQQILANSSKPLQDVRMFSMLFFRTQRSFVKKFNRSMNDDQGIYNVESWLLHHGRKLEGRFLLQSYKTMIHLLNTVDVSKGRSDFAGAVKGLRSRVTLMGIEGDLLFPPETIREAVPALKAAGVDATYLEIRTSHGHDAFLIEFDQMSNLLSDIFSDHRG